LLRDRKEAGTMMSQQVADTNGTRHKGSSAHTGLQPRALADVIEGLLVVIIERSKPHERTEDDRTHDRETTHGGDGNGP
jgi:hypothetical protein